MARLQVKDLTPELLAEMNGLETAEEVKEFLGEKNFEISDNGAEAIASQLREGSELTEEQLAAVSGGCGSGEPYGGTGNDK